MMQKRRVAAVLDGKADPGFAGETARPKEALLHRVSRRPELAIGPAQLANDQIVAHIQSKFAGYGLALLVDAVLRADGWVTKLSPLGADGGADILAERAPLGLDAAKLCVHVKSQSSPADVTIYRTLRRSMQSLMPSRDFWCVGVDSIAQCRARRDKANPSFACGKAVTL
jgi:hypothetical protein